MKSPTTDALELVKACCRVLDDKKAGDLTVLDVSEQSSITDYLVVATATSEPHLRALRIELEKLFDDQQVHLVGKEIVQESGWVVIDAFDVMVHLFLTEKREHYGLERLWRDASEVDLGKLLTPPAASQKSGKKKAARKPQSPKPKAKKATRRKAR